MGQTCRIAGLVMAAVLVGSTRSAAGPLEPLTLEVLVLDGVGVPADILQQAQDEASRIFELSGIRLVWAGGRTPNARHVILKIASAPPSRKSRQPGVLGLAVETNQATGILAWLFYDRIDEHRRVLGLEAPLLLGHVMAHEMGHLLLPTGSHVQSGVMRGGWDKLQASLAKSRSLRFGPDETREIRAHLLRDSNLVAMR